MTWSSGSREMVGTVRAWLRSPGPAERAADRTSVVRGDGRKVSCFIPGGTILGRQWWRQGTLLLTPGTARWEPYWWGEAQEVSGHLLLSTVQALSSTDLNVKRHLFEEVVAMSGDEVVRLAVPKADTPVLTQWLAHTDMDQDHE